MRAYAEHDWTAAANAETQHESPESEVSQMPEPSHDPAAECGVCDWRSERTACPWSLGARRGLGSLGILGRLDS